MRFLLGFILGAIVGAYGLRLSGQHAAVPPVMGNPSVADTARDSAVGVGDAVSEKLAAWHLAPEDIRADLARHGRGGAAEDARGPAPGSRTPGSSR